MNNKLYKIQKVLIFIPFIGFINIFFCMHIYYKFTVKYSTLIKTIIESFILALPPCIIGAILLNNLELGIMYDVVNFLMIYFAIMIVSAVCYHSQMKILQKMNSNENDKNK